MPMSAAFVHHKLRTWIMCYLITLCLEVFGALL